MSTAIIITGMICVTVIVMGVLNSIDNAIKAKNTPKTIFEALGMTDKKEEK